MRNCNHCGAAQEPDASVCTECGTPMEDTLVDTPKVIEAPAEPIPETAPPAAPISLEKSEEAVPAPQTEPEQTAEHHDEPPSPPKKPFPTKIVVGAAAVLAVVVILIAALMPKEKFEHTSLVFQALGDTFAACSAEFDQASKEIGLAPILDAFAQKGTTAEISMTVPIEDFGSFSFHMIQAQNAAGDQAYVKADVGAMGFNLSVLEASLDKRFLAFSSPFLFGGVYGVPLDQLEEKLPQSELGMLLDLDEETIAPIVEYIDASTQLYSMDMLSRATITALDEALLQLEEATTTTGPVEETATVNGNELSCERYVTDIPTKSLETYLLACTDTFFEDEWVADYFDALFAMEQGYYDEDLVAETKTEFEESIREACAEIQSVTLTVYLKDGLALRSELSVVTRSDQEAKFVLELGGDGNLTDAATLGCYFNGTDSMILSHTGHIIPQDGMVESTLVFSFSSSEFEEQMDAEYFFQWDTRQTENNFHMSGVAPFHPSELAMDGSVRLDGGIFIEPFEIYYYDGYSMEYTMPTSLLITPTETIKSLTAEARDILTLSEAEIQALMMEIENSFSRWFGYGF